MRSQAGSLWVTGFALLIALGVGACSKSSSSTTAPPPGKELDSGDFGAGLTFSHQFNKAGTFNYHCIHHSPMTGSITVADNATATSGSINIISSSSPFPALPGAIKTGSTVTWTNSTGAVHTVTSD